MSALLPPTAVTTRHSVSLFPWQAGSTLPAAGPVLGLNVLAGGTVFHYDPWQCYADGILTSPNMVVLGQLGKGKSALVKTYLNRQLLAGRQVYILDPKGEYGPLAAARGLAHLRLAPGSPDRLNPLEPADGDSGPDTDRRRAGTVAALAATGLGRDLTAEERAAIGAATGGLPAGAVLTDVAGQLLEPPAALADALRTTPAALAAAIRPAALELRRLLTGDLAGIVDRPSTSRLDPDGPGLVLDLSAAFGTPALPAVMVSAGGWLSHALARPGPRQRLLLVDEAWALLGLPATTAWLQGLSKLARAHGIQLITVVHRGSDLAGQADAGTATRAQAQGLLTDAETRVIYTQAPAERALLADLLGLTAAETDLIARLPAYRALWLIGDRAAVVDHVLSPDEARRLVDTDSRMRSDPYEFATSEAKFAGTRG